MKQIQAVFSSAEDNQTLVTFVSLFAWVFYTPGLSNLDSYRKWRLRFLTEWLHTSIPGTLASSCSFVTFLPWSHMEPLEPLSCKTAKLRARKPIYVLHSAAQATEATEFPKPCRNAIIWPHVTVLPLDCFHASPCSWGSAMAQQAGAAT
jgi:hypothetical protein